MPDTRDGAVGDASDVIEASLDGATDGAVADTDGPIDTAVPACAVPKSASATAFSSATWATRIGGSSVGPAATVEATAVDATGATYVTGHLSGTIAVGGVTPPARPYSATSTRAAATTVGCADGRSRSPIRNAP